MALTGLNGGAGQDSAHPPPKNCPHPGGWSLIGAQGSFALGLAPQKGFSGLWPEGTVGSGVTKKPER